MSLRVIGLAELRRAPAGSQSTPDAISRIRGHGSEPAFSSSRVPLSNSRRQVLGRSRSLLTSTSARGPAANCSAAWHSASTPPWTSSRYSTRSTSPNHHASRSSVWTPRLASVPPPACAGSNAKPDLIGHRYTSALGHIDTPRPVPAGRCCTTVATIRLESKKRRTRPTASALPDSAALSIIRSQSRTQSGHRLLDQHVHPRAQEIDRHRRVQVVGHRQQGGIDPADRLPVVGRAPLDVVRRRQLPRVLVPCPQGPPTESRATRRPPGDGSRR